MPTTCEIEFENNPSKVVYSGQLLRGNVQLSLTKSKKVRGVFIKICGKAYCHWSTGSGRTKRSHTGKEDYLDERTYLMGGEEGEVRLTPGLCNYTFQCVLPPQLPTSFEGEYGHIRYTACVVLDIPIWPDKEFEVAFTVIKPINLNANPTLRMPAVVERQEIFYPCCLLFCYESNPLDIIVRAPVSGYTPGQTINLQIEANNKSDQPVDEFKVQLIKQIHYYTSANSSNSKHETVVLSEGKTRGCDSNSEADFRVNIIVPAIPPTDTTTSNIIKVEYSIRIIGSVENVVCKTDPEFYLPIIIGSIPIVDNLLVAPMDPYPGMSNVPHEQMPTNGVISQQPTAPLLGNGENLFNLPYPNAPSPSAPYPSEDPPTYEEATQFGNKETVFKPKYPMFRRQTSYSN